MKLKVAIRFRFSGIHSGREKVRQRSWTSRQVQRFADERETGMAERT